MDKYINAGGNGSRHWGRHGNYIHISTVCRCEKGWKLQHLICSYQHLKSYVTYINYMSKDSYVCRSERIEYFEFSSAYLFNKFRATNPYIYKSHDFTSAPGYKIDCWFYSESLEWVERQGGNLTFSYSSQHLLLVDPHSTATKRG